MSLVALSVLLAAQPPAAPPAPPAVKALLAAKPLAAEPGDDEERKLLKEMHNEALNVLKLEELRFTVVQGNEFDTYLATRRLAMARWVEASLDLRPAAADRIEVLTQAVAVAKYVEDVLVDRQRGGVVRAQTVSVAKGDRLGYELRLLRAKRAAKL